MSPAAGRCAGDLTRCDPDDVAMDIGAFASATDSLLIALSKYSDCCPGVAVAAAGRDISKT